MWRISNASLWLCAALLALLALPAFAAQVPAYTCASCHVQAKTQPSTSMAHALRIASENPLFKTHPNLTLKRGQFFYSIDTHNGNTTYSVSNGVQSISAPVHWVFGEGSQTYVLKRDGHLYESIVSYYPKIGGLDVTMGDERIHPKTLVQAFGRPLQTIESSACFGCHTTGAIVDHQLNVHSLHPGVTCEHCHVGAKKHLQGFLDGNPAYKPPDLNRSSSA